MTTNPFSATRDIKSIGIIVIYLLVPLFMVSVLTYTVIDFIGGLGLFAMLGPANMSWGQEYLALIKTFVTQLDTVILLIFATLIGRLTIQSFRTDMHPIYGIVGLFSIPVLIFLSGFGSNIIAIFTDIEILAAASNQFTYSYTFFQNTPAIVGWIAVFILLVMIGSGVLLRKRRGGGI